jgi:3-methyladenine DNA glycosylase AlkD
MKTIKRLQQELKNNIDEKALNTSHRFFKENERAKVYGVRAACVNKIAKEFFKEIKCLSKTEKFSLCEELWKSNYLEEIIVACNWSYWVCKQYEPSDFKIFERWVQDYVNNWAACDTLCNHTIGEFIEMYPKFISNLKKWAYSTNRWVRRAAAVTLIVPARKGLFLDDILEIAAILLCDKDDMVQKGYGWALKAAGEAHQHDVFDFVMKHKSIMPRTSLRYAIEKMPSNMKAEAMKR